MPRIQSSQKAESLKSQSLRKKTGKVVRILDNLYGAEVWGGGTDPLNTLIKTILSQNTNDQNRDQAYAGLRSRFSTWEEVMGGNLRAIGRAIRVGGLANQKARNIQDFLRWLKRTRGKLDLKFICEMDPEGAISLLCQHRGIGVKTACVTLMFACGRDVFPVDTHVHRISRRLGLVPEKCTAEKAHELLSPLIPKGKSLSFHVNLIEFGRGICRARNPACGSCPLRASCLYVKGKVKA